MGSEFSDAKDGLESVRWVIMRFGGEESATILTTVVVARSWDEKQVISWLHTINCGQYESLFKGNPMINTILFRWQRHTEKND